ncbi:MAG: hypothetical protein WCK74_03790 [Gemmatimonadaceae bacterium]
MDTSYSKTGARVLRRAVPAVLALGVLSTSAAAQERAPERAQALDLTVDGVGLSLGNSRGVTGVRINWRDTRLERVTGANVTGWMPRVLTGRVTGLAVGLPLTGAERLHGLSIGGGVGAATSLDGLSATLIGAGAGRTMRGIHVAGIGVGAGTRLDGIALGGIGAGVGGDVRGIMAGGIGAGIGGNARGLLAGGIGAGVGGNLEGIALGGVGIGAGGNAHGLLIGGIGAGVGGNLEGIVVSGVGVGAGGELRGVAISGVGIGASSIRGVALAGIGVGGHDLHGLIAAPLLVKTLPGGVMQGIAVSAFTDARGARQHGLMIGMLNLTDELEGVQLGLLNIARRNPEGRRIMPLVNWNFAGH